MAVVEDDELGLFREDRRVFLGWDVPVLEVLRERLLASPAALARTLVVVPTAESGRALRESLAAAGGCLSPEVVTPGGLMGRLGSGPEVASEAVEVLAWVEVLEGVGDWGAYATVFPDPPGAGEQSGWSLGLARSLVGVRKGLQERGLTITSAARRLGNTVEGERWLALARLEAKVGGKLKSWGLAGRSEVLGMRDASFRMQDCWPGLGRVVLAGVADVPEVAVRMLEGSNVPMEVLVAAPEEMADRFDDWGRPLGCWAEEEIAWPGTGSVRLVADTREQAEEAFRVVAEGARSSDRVALGAADEETAEELERVGAREGWPVFYPGKEVRAPWLAWLGAWRSFLRHPGVVEAIDLLGCAETGALVRGKRAQRVRALSKARDSHLVRQGEDVARALARLEDECGRMRDAGEEERADRRARLVEELRLAMETMDLLEKRRTSFLREGFHDGLGRLLPVLDPGGESGLEEWVGESSGLAAEVSRDPGFWIDLLVADAPGGQAVEPGDRVLDVVGWLELFYEPGDHLVICGMNEGLVPAQESSDPWLPESVRRVLGLSTAEARAARDAYLLTAMMKMRETNGRVDLLLAKSTLGGDVLKPSRLLLAAKGEELARRVEELFREVEPPESGLAWTLDERFRWQRPICDERVEKLSVTAFSDYLACPFRFYLKHVRRMQEPEPERVEWNARDFGTVAHLVLERWGRDPEAREYSKVEAIEEWVLAELDRVVGEGFGGSPPLAVRIQREAMAQRLSWFARVQACERAAGWRVVEVERNFSLTIGGIEVRGQVDRIEEHQDGRRRILDYKTSAAAKKVEQAHLRRVTAATRWPEHLEGVEKVSMPGGKKRWINLQVPIYSAALGSVDELGYFALGATEADVDLVVWEGFGTDEEESAMACARWIAGQVEAGEFWPPAERVEFDDYEALAFGRSLREAFPKPEFLVEGGTQ